MADLQAREAKSALRIFGPCPGGYTEFAGTVWRKILAYPAGLVSR